MVVVPLGKLGGTRVGMCARPVEVCVPGVFAMQPSVWSSGLLGTPVCVQLDLQDVFIREAIPSCTMHTHTHTQVLTSFSSDGAGLRGQCAMRHCAICSVCST